MGRESAGAMQGVQIGHHNIQLNMLSSEVCRTVLTEEEFHRLHDLLLGMPAVRDVPALLRTAVGAVADRQPGDAGPVHCVEWLRGQVDASLLFVFVEYLGAAATNPASRRQLREWVDTVAGNWLNENGLDQLARLRSTLDAGGMAKPPRRLTILVEPDVLTGGRYDVRAWLSADTEANWVPQLHLSEQPLAGLRDEVTGLIERTLPGWPRSQDPAVTFAVSPELVTTPFEQWTVGTESGPVALGGLLAVVVRLAPLEPSDAAAHERWNRYYAAGRDAIEWFDDETAPRPLDGRLLALIGEEVCRPANVVRVLHATGAMAALWHRGARHDRRASIEDVLYGRPLARLPDTVRSQRAQALEPDAGADHPGHDLVLLWADPAHQPITRAILEAPRRKVRW
nr:hypothetical protein GCM10020063_082220 [Dactylosporangium thailandense]